MSINKIYVPSKKNLVIFLKTNGSFEFYKKFIKNKDTHIGTVSAISFISKFIKLYDGNCQIFYEIN